MMHSFFLKRLKKYFTLLMIPSILLLVVILIISGTSQLRTLKRSSVDALDNMHAAFASIYEDICYQQNMMTVNPQLSLSLRKILMRRSSSYTDYVFLNSMKSILKTAAGSHPSVHSIYLYIDQYDNLLSSSDGVVPVADYYDNAWADLYAGLSDDEDNVVVRRVIPASSYSRETSVLTVFQRLTYIRGVIVLNIEERTFLDSMGAFLPASDYSLLVLDRRCAVLLSKIGANDSRLSELEALPDRADLGNDAAKPYFSRVNGRYYLIAQAGDNSLDLDFLLLRPFSSVVSGVFAGLIAPLLIVVFIGMLILLLAWVNTRQNFRQINYVIQLFKDAEDGTLTAPLIHPSQINNEYDLIINNVIRSFMNTTFLDKQLAEQRYEKQNAELTALQLQINPHFLMNTLQTLDFEVCKLTNSFHSPLSLIINNLSDILRYALAPIDDPVTVQDEIVNVRKYVEIQNFRFPDTIFVEYDVDEEALAIPFKRLLLQPLVENSISHGIRPAMRPGRIRVRIAIRSGQLNVRCTDNGVGIPQDRLEKLRDNLRKGDNNRNIGLNNVNRRLILNYGEGSALKVLSHEGLGTCIAFSIPLGQDHENR